MHKNGIKLNYGKIINPCYNEKTGTDCERRAVGCREKCNLYKIYKTLKAVEAKNKSKEITANNVIFEEIKGKSRRLKRLMGQKGG